MHGSDNEEDYYYDENADSRPVCNYGALCYRKNPQHIEDFKHPGSTTPAHVDSNKPNKRKTPPTSICLCFSFFFSFV